MGLFDSLRARLSVGGGERDFFAANLQGIGAREAQEDSFALINAADAAKLRQKGLFALVADGMGGMENGKAASELAAGEMVLRFHALCESRGIAEQLYEGACAVSDRIYSEFSGSSGTTLVAAHIFENRLHWLSVGDSAIFILRNGGVFQINREHSFLNKLYSKAIAEESFDKTAQEHPDRARLSSFIGIDCLGEVDFNLRAMELLPGDVLLLCSDGVSGVLSPLELLEAMSLAPEEGCNLLEAFIAERALPEQDNYTAIIIACK